MRFVLLSLSVLLVGCGHAASPPAVKEWQDANTVSSASSSVASSAQTSSLSSQRSTSALTISDFRLKLRSDMTTDDLIAAFGNPDQTMGSGLSVLQYVLQDGSTVTIGVAGSHILYANHTATDGTQEALISGQ